VPDDDGPTITRCFKEFRKGRYSLKTLAAKAREEGWTVGGRRLHRSTLHLILRKRIYTGDFDWDGVTHHGKHEALVSQEMWEEVQALLDRRAETKQRRIRHDFAFPGFIRCGHCGCGLVGELKKQKYVYYHCTGHRGKCEEPYAREEVVQDQFAAALKELVIPPAILKTFEENPMALARHINKHLCSYTPGDRFATAVFLRLSRDSGELTYVNAGHNAPIVFGSGPAIGLEATGLPLDEDPARRDVAHSERHHQLGESSGGAVKEPRSSQPRPWIVPYTDTGRKRRYR
jgi:hypothetical protein